MLGNIIIGAILLAVVGIVIYVMVRDKKKGKGVCGGDCSKCKGCH